jgi:hypothetical protein
VAPGRGGAGLLFADPRSRRERPLVVGMLLAGVAAVIPGVYFRPHYFIVLLRAAAILIGVAVTGDARLLQKARTLPAILFVIAVAATLGTQWDALFNL